MPALWIITPFSENNCDSAITNMVSCYADYSHVRVSGGGAVPLNEGSYNLKCHFGFPPGTLCGAGDAVIIVAHGAESGSALYSASRGGTSKTQAGLFNDLRGFRAKRARQVFFSVCFSAVGGHCAAKWKTENPGQDVYGCIGILCNPITVTGCGTVRNMESFTRLH